MSRPARPREVVAQPRRRPLSAMCLARFGGALGVSLLRAWMSREPRHTRRRRQTWTCVRRLCSDAHQPARVRVVRVTWALSEGTSLLASRRTALRGGPLSTTNLTPRLLRLSTAPLSPLLPPVASQNKMAEADLLRQGRHVPRLEDRVCCAPEAYRQDRGPEVGGPRQDRHGEGELAPYDPDWYYIRARAKRGHARTLPAKGRRPTARSSASSARA